MTTDTIITQFELQVNDITELSSVEELMLLNRIYRKICNERPWEFLKTNVTGFLSFDSTSSMYYITMPADFAYFIENANYTDSSRAYDNPAVPKVIFVGANYAPYQVVNYSDRLKYRTAGGYAYADFANNKIWFTQANNTNLSITSSYNFDYIKVPATLTAGQTPIIPTQFQEVIVFGMATANDVLQLSDKARSYQKENQAIYDQYILDMAYWNSLQFNN